MKLKFTLASLLLTCSLARAESPEQWVKMADNIRNPAEQINELSYRMEKFDLVVGLLRDWQDEMRQTYEP